MSKLAILLASVAVSAVIGPSGPITFNSTEAIINARFAADPDNGWQGFPDGHVFTTTVTATTPSAVKTACDAWAAGSPLTTTLDVICDWDGPLSGPTSFSGPTPAKLVSDPNRLFGYGIGTGGVRIRAAAGRNPQFASRMTFTGYTRIEFDGVDFKGPRGSGTVDASYSLIIQQNTSFFPAATHVALKNCEIGVKNGASPFAQSDICGGFKYANAASVYQKNVRYAGCSYGTFGWAEYIDLDDIEFDQCWYDHIPVRGFTAAYSSRFCWLRITNILGRNPITLATTQHIDGIQLGNDDQNLGYMYLFKNIIFIEVQQGSFLGVQSSPAKFQGTVENVLCSLNAYHGHVMYDPSQAGHTFIRNCSYYRGQTPVLNTDGTVNQDNYPQLTANSGVGGGAVRSMENCIVDRVVMSAGVATVNGGRYVSPQKTGSVPAGRSGLVAGQPMRMEEYISGTGGTFSRSASGHLYYTLPAGAFSHDKATAFYAIRDFFEPLPAFGGYSDIAGVSDPETWVGAPIRP